MGLEDDWCKEDGVKARRAPQWDDNSLISCKVCHEHFTGAQRRHHCRYCGWIVCHSCSNLTLDVDRWLSDSSHELSVAGADGEQLLWAHAAMSAIDASCSVGTERPASLCRKKVCDNCVRNAPPEIWARRLSALRAIQIGTDDGSASCADIAQNCAHCIAEVGNTVCSCCPTEVEFATSEPADVELRMAATDASVAEARDEVSSATLAFDGGPEIVCHMRGPRGFSHQMSSTICVGHLSDLELQLRGCCALATLMEGSDANCQAVVEAGGVELVIAALQTHQYADELHRHGFNLLQYSLTSSRGSQSATTRNASERIVKAGGIPLIMTNSWRMLTQSPACKSSDRRLALGQCMTLLAALLNAPQNTTPAVRLGAVAATVAIMRAYPRNVTAHVHCATVLCNLLRYGGSAGRKAVLVGEGVHALLTAVRALPDSPEVQLAGWGALGQWSDGRLSVKAILEAARVNDFYDFDSAQDKTEKALRELGALARGVSELNATTAKKSKQAIKAKALTSVQTKGIRRVLKAVPGVIAVKDVAVKNRPRLLSLHNEL